MTPQEMINTKEVWITEEWLKAEGYEQDKIGAGSFPWRKNIGNDTWVVIDTNTDCGDIEMAIYDKDISLTYRKRRPARFLKSDIVALEYTLQGLFIRDLENSIDKITTEIQV